MRSCWAFGASESLSGRFCIASNGNINAVLSPQYLVDCEKYSQGCDGGNPTYAWRFMQLLGIPDETCVTYTGNDGSRPTTCSDGSMTRLYYAANFAAYSNSVSIQAAVMVGGPMEVSFDVYQVL